MKIQFTYNLGPTVARCEYDTVQQVIRYNGMCMPIRCVSPQMQTAAIKARTDYQRKQAGQAGHGLLFMGD